MWGSRRYDTRDGSRNNALLAFFTLGDGWHNNHHHSPGSARAGEAWWEIDPAYRMLQLLSLVGLVWDVRTVVRPVAAIALSEEPQPVVVPDVELAATVIP